MNDIKKRLTRTLSGPRRCVKCQKMVYLSIYRCKQCGELTHKHCLFHANHSCKPSAPDVPDGNGFSILKPAEIDGWRSPASSHEPWPPRPRRYTDSPASIDAEEAYRAEMQGPGPGVAMAGLLKIVHWLSSHKKRPRETIGRTSEKHTKGKFGLHLNMEDKQTQKKLKTLIKNYQRQMYNGNYYSPQYQQQQQPPNLNSHQALLRQRMRRPSTAIDGDPMSPRSSVSSQSSFMSPASTPEIDTVRLRRDKMVKQASIKWERDVAKSSIIANCSSVFAKMPIDYTDRQRHSAVSPKPSLRPNESGWISGNKGSVFGQQRSILESKATTVSFARPPNLAKAKTLSVESRECQNESLCATWPPAGKILEEIVDEGENDCIEEAEEAEESCFTMSDFRSDSQSGEESLKEWYIPFGDIEFKERIRHGRRGDIYKGR
ncbi:hypothetical protein JTE90_000819 [Oedothorax gibbosus]|uniref:Phorbol-ester/DAG-type domain-containing protein n=1 Tax=Oedothorax gibbosus TaxID=931172 RepID=A0AAV6VS71_9ARAC|nr:hypothetical protein JTE90_000819 [Oedothorax gibbosus]